MMDAAIEWSRAWDLGLAEAAAFGLRLAIVTAAYQVPKLWTAAHGLRVRGVVGAVLVYGAVLLLAYGDGTSRSCAERDPMAGCVDATVEADTRTATERAGNMLHWAILLPVAAAFGFSAGRAGYQAEQHRRAALALEPSAAASASVTSYHK